MTGIFIAGVDSFWQAALLAALAWLAMRRTLHLNAATRVAIWWAVLAVVLLLPFAPALISTVRRSFEPKVIESAHVLYAPASPSPAVEMTPLVTVAKPEAATWPVWISLLWGTVVVFRLGHLKRSYLHLRGLKHGATISGFALPQIGRTARLLLSPAIDSPVAVGFIRPAVVLPESLSARLSLEDLDHVILHEVAHLARYDDWTNLLSRILSALVVLHPVALWILRRIDVERESACDDWVVTRTQSARSYGQTLVRLHELRSERWTAEQLLAPGIFGRGSGLPDRLEKLMRAGREFTSRVSMGSVAVVSVLLAGLVLAASFSPRWIVLAETSRPAFEVASIKRHTELTRRITFATRAGGRLEVLNDQIANVIYNAYGILPYQLIGAPQWVTSPERYDIDARGASNASRKEIMLMLQTLLADRFAMKAHLETREMQAYILSVAKGGPKISFTGSEDCIPFDSAKPNPEAVPNVCGNNFFSAWGWNGEHISMPDVIDSMSHLLERPVIDKTGIGGTFDVHMKYADDLAAGDHAADAPPSFQTALHETLGLDVKAGRGGVEVLVIDHIEPPKEN